MAASARPAPAVNVELQAPQVEMAPTARKELEAQQVHVEILALLVPQALKAPPEPPGYREKVVLDLPACVVSAELPAPLVETVQTACKAPEAQRACMGPRVRLGLRALLALPELLVYKEKVVLGLLARAVSAELPARRDKTVQTARRAPEVQRARVEILARLAQWAFQAP